jgi:hypothetical protein
VQAVRLMLFGVWAYGCSIILRVLTYINAHG